MATLIKNHEFTILDFTKVLADVLKETNAKISFIEEFSGNVNRVFITRQDSESSPEKDIIGSYLRLFYIPGCETFYMGYCLRCCVVDKQRVYLSSLTKNDIKLMNNDITAWLSYEE